MPLATVPAGNHVRIDGLDLSPELALRCQTLGILLGESITVLDNRKPCPLLVGACGARLMIGRELATRLSVTPLACGDVE